MLYPLLHRKKQSSPGNHDRDASKEAIDEEVEKVSEVFPSNQQVELSPEDEHDDRVDSHQLAQETETDNDKEKTVHRKVVQKVLERKKKQRIIKSHET